jgi:hypothetical protein
LKERKKDVSSLILKLTPTVHRHKVGKKLSTHIPRANSYGTPLLQGDFEDSTSDSSGDENNFLEQIAVDAKFNQRNS